MNMLRRPQRNRGLAGIRRYLRDNPPPTLHHRAMLLWASSYLSDIQTDEERAATVADLLSLQKPDGGWCLATLGNWKRTDELAQDTESSDGYGTGFVLFVLRRSGMSPSEEPLKRGVAWLKTHQRESGRWFTRSLNQDGMHYITHAGTAMALMALSACEAQLATTPSAAAQILIAPGSARGSLAIPVRTVARLGVPRSPLSS